MKRPKTFRDWQRLYWATYEDLGEWASLYFGDRFGLTRYRISRPSESIRQCWRLMRRAERIRLRLHAEIEAGTTGAMTALCNMVMRDGRTE